MNIYWRPIRSEYMRSLKLSLRNVMPILGKYIKVLIFLFMDF